MFTLISSSLQRGDEGRVTQDGILNSRNRIEAIVQVADAVKGIVRIKVISVSIDIDVSVVLTVGEW